MKWALALLCLILLAPLALVDVPPLLDYPNHLARATVLALGASDPVLSRMYASHWAVIPNLGTDLVLPPLVRVLPVHLAGRIVVSIALLLPVLGTVAYSRATFRVNAAWPLASALVAYNAALLLGFLNFVAAIGIALLLAAAWIAWRDRHARRVVALAAIGTVALFFCHLMGLLFFYVLIAGHELERLWSHRLRAAPAAVRFAALAALVVAPLGLYLLSPLAPLADETEFSSLADKADQLVLPFANYILPLDIATACLVGAFLLACIAKRCCRVTPGSGVVLLLTALLFLAAPWSFKGTYFLDTRFVIMLGFLLFGAVLPTGLPRTAEVSAVAAVAMLFAVRMAVVAFAWIGHRHDVADLRAVTATIGPGARVFIASAPPEQVPRYWRNAPLSRQLSFGIRLDHHLPALLLVEHRAYWPFLFDNPSQQPVETLLPYRELAKRTDAIADSRALAVPGKVDLCGFDYVLLLEAGGEPDLAHFATDRLLLVAQSDFAAVFRIRPAACALLSHSGATQQ
jgi:hypothetical protein